MNRLSLSIGWVCVIVVASFMLYNVKYKVQSLKAQIEETSKEIAQEKESLRVVSAEWAYLNRPERLKSLADKYLAGKAVTVDQVAEIEAIAFRERDVASVDAEGADLDSDTRAILASYRSNSVRQ